MRIVKEQRVSAREFAARVGRYRAEARSAGVVRVADRGRPDGAYVSEAVLEELTALREVVADMTDAGGFAGRTGPDAFGPRPPGYVPRHASPD